MKKNICALIGLFALIGAIGVVSAHTYSRNVIMYLPSWGNIAYETDDYYGSTKDSSDSNSSISTLAYAGTLRPRGAICTKTKVIKSTWVTLYNNQISFPVNSSGVNAGTMYYAAGRSNNLEPTGDLTLVYRFTPDDVR